MNRVFRVMVMAISLMAIAMALYTTIRIEQDDPARSLLNRSVMMKNNVDNPDLDDVVLEHAQYLHDLSRTTKMLMLTAIAMQWCSTAIIVLLCVYMFRSPCRKGTFVPMISTDIERVQFSMIYGGTVAECENVMAALEEEGIGSWLAKANLIKLKPDNQGIYVVIVNVEQHDNARRAITANCNLNSYERLTACPACGAKVSVNPAECPDCGLHLT